MLPQLLRVEVLVPLPLLLAVVLIHLALLPPRPPVACRLRLRWHHCVQVEVTELHPLVHAAVDCGRSRKGTAGGGDDRRQRFPLCLAEDIRQGRLPAALRCTLGGRAGLESSSPHGNQKLTLPIVDIVLILILCTIRLPPPLNDARRVEVAIPPPAVEQRAHLQWQPHQGAGDGRPPAGHCMLLLCVKHGHVPLAIWLLAQDALSLACSLRQGVRRWRAA